MLGNRNGPRLRVRPADGKLSEYGAAVSRATTKSCRYPESLHPKQPIVRMNNASFARIANAD